MVSSKIRRGQRKHIFGDYNLSVDHDGCKGHMRGLLGQNDLCHPGLLLYWSEDRRLCARQFKGGRGRTPLESMRAPALPFERRV